MYDILINSQILVLRNSSVNIESVMLRNTNFNGAHIVISSISYLRINRIVTQDGA